MYKCISAARCRYSRIFRHPTTVASPVPTLKVWTLNAVNWSVLAARTKGGQIASVRFC